MSETGQLYKIQTAQEIVEPSVLNLAYELNGLDSNKRYERYRELWDRVTKEKIVSSFPLHLDIELSGKCNLKCEYCFQNDMITTPLGFMSFDLFKKIIDESVPKGLCGIKLQIRGESFLHKQLFDCIRYAKSAGIVDVQITTNATLLSEEKRVQILESGLDFIIFSFDSHHLDQISARKREEVEQNIKKFLELRASAGASKPHVRVQASIPQMTDVRRAAEEERLRNLFQLADIFMVSKIHNFDYAKDAYDGVGDGAQFLPCHYLFQRMAVFWDGTVTTCCMDYNATMALGNLKQSSIEEIWLGKGMAWLRRKHLGGERKSVDVCNKCPVALSGVEYAPLQDHKREHY